MVEVKLHRHSTNTETLKINLGNDTYLLIDRYVFPDNHEEYRLRILRHGMTEHRDKKKIAIGHEYEYAGEDGPEWCNETDYVDIDRPPRECEETEEAKHKVKLDLSGLAEIEYTLEQHPISKDFYNTFVIVSVDVESKVGKELWETFVKSVKEG